MARANLDALIPREDFKAEDAVIDAGKKKGQVSLQDLEETGWFYKSLRKPDFQRETSEWTPAKICGFVKTFLDGDLIPSLILWRNEKGYTFVIDGSHRISALLAWINDDYGDGAISKRFFEEVIPEEQLEIAAKTRKLIRVAIGPYSDYILAHKSPEKVRQDILGRIPKLGTLAIDLQWVEGNSDKAEASFLKINQLASPINKTELALINARKLPSGLATRGILKSGRGQQYWDRFEVKPRLKQVSEQTNKILFAPPIKEPIKTVDLPIAGHGYSADTLPLVLGFVESVNRDADGKISDAVDTDGRITLDYLEKCLHIAQRISSKEPFSLGLHPAIYFYSQEGKYKAASFRAVIDFIAELEKTDAFDDFTDARARIENFLFDNDQFIQQIVRKHRGAVRAAPHIKNFFLFLMKKFLEGKTADEIIKNEIAKSDFNYLTVSPSPNLTEYGKEIPTEVKNLTFLSQAVPGTIKCGICQGFLDSKSMSYDHITRKREGGTGNPENVQLAHFYCNTTYKN